MQSALSEEEFIARQSTDVRRKGIKVIDSQLFEQFWHQVLAHRRMTSTSEDSIPYFIDHRHIVSFKDHVEHAISALPA
jgi:hypothetical protein